MGIPAHGGDIYDYKRPLLDFSANLNPLGMPEPVARAARAAVGDAAHYPDPECRALREAIGAMDGVNPAWILCGNGAADVIFRLVLARRPGKAMVLAPTFSEYEQALRAAGCPVKHWLLRASRGFVLEEDILEAIRPGLDMLFLCSPNNPTGLCADDTLLRRILARCGETGTRLVVDECFLPLTGGAGLGGALGDNPHLFLLRAFTKSFAIPGLRLGYGLSSDGALLSACRDSGQAWSVSCVAQAAGIAACGCAAWPERARAFLRVERPRLQAGLRSLGLEVWPGEANYLLFRAENITDLKALLVERGILIRSCANYRGLGPDFYRTAVRLPEENDRLLEALGEVLPWQKQL